MKHKIFEFLGERNIDSGNLTQDELYSAGIQNVMANIEFYFDKPYTCESVIKELFIRGVSEFIKKKSTN